MTNIEKLEKFIIDNNLTFVEGNSNTNAVVICGYGCYLEATVNEINTAILQSDVNIADITWLEGEIERVFEFADDNAYADYWLTDKASDEWKFEKED